MKILTKFTKLFRHNSTAVDTTTRVPGNIAQNILDITAAQLYDTIMRFFNNSLTSSHASLASIFYHAASDPKAELATLQQFFRINKDETLHILSHGVQSAKKAGFSSDWTGSEVQLYHKTTTAAVSGRAMFVALSSDQRTFEVFCWSGIRGTKQLFDKSTRLFTPPQELKCEDIIRSFMHHRLSAKGFQLPDEFSSRKQYTATKAARS